MNVFSGLTPPPPLPTPHQFVTTNMWMVKPQDVLGKYSYVFVLLDDIKLLPTQNPTSRLLQSSSQDPSSQIQNPSQTESPSLLHRTTTSSSSSSSRKKRGLKSAKMFDLSMLLSIMRRNNLTAAR